MKISMMIVMSHLPQAVGRTIMEKACLIEKEPGVGKRNVEARTQATSSNSFLLREPECLRLTKCMQKAAESLHGIGDLYDRHARLLAYFDAEWY